MGVCVRIAMLDKGTRAKAEIPLMAHPEKHSVRYTVSQFLHTPDPVQLIYEKETALESLDLNPAMCYSFCKLLISGFTDHKGG